MVSGPGDHGFSELSIPVWQAYCRRHGVDFFLQEEVLNTDYRLEWSKPRLLLEIMAKAPWKYLFLVDPNSLPANFGKHWEYTIKAHLRYRRHANDKAVSDGACYGPLLSGCISWAKAKKQKTISLVR